MLLLQGLVALQLQSSRRLGLAEMQQLLHGLITILTISSSSYCRSRAGMDRSSNIEGRWQRRAVMMRACPIQRRMRKAAVARSQREGVARLPGILMMMRVSLASPPNNCMTS